VDNALLIHQYELTANTKLKDEPPCLDTAAPVCRVLRISSPVNLLNRRRNLLVRNINLLRVRFPFS